MSAQEFPRHPAFEAAIPPAPSAARPAQTNAPTALSRRPAAHAVFLRLLFVSARRRRILVWLHIHPYDVFFWIAASSTGCGRSAGMRCARSWNMCSPA